MIRRRPIRRKEKVATDVSDEVRQSSSSRECPLVAGLGRASPANRPEGVWMWAQLPEIGIMGSLNAQNTIRCQAVSRVGRTTQPTSTSSEIDVTRVLDDRRGVVLLFRPRLIAGCVRVRRRARSASTAIAHSRRDVSELALSPAAFFPALFEAVLDGVLAPGELAGSASTGATPSRVPATIPAAIIALVTSHPPGLEAPGGYRGSPSIGPNVLCRASAFNKKGPPVRTALQ
jgi:hypothetical protein